MLMGRNMFQFCEKSLPRTDALWRVYNRDLYIREGVAMGK